MNPSIDLAQDLEALHSRKRVSQRLLMVPWRPLKKRWKRLEATHKRHPCRVAIAVRRDMVEASYIDNAAYVIKAAGRPLHINAIAERISGMQ